MYGGLGLASKFNEKSGVVTAPMGTAVQRGGGFGRTSRSCGPQLEPRKPHRAVGPHRPCAGLVCGPRSRGGTCHQGVDLPAGAAAPRPLMNVVALWPGFPAAGCKTVPRSIGTVVKSRRGHRRALARRRRLFPTFVHSDASTHIGAASPRPIFDARETVRRLPVAAHSRRGAGERWRGRGRGMFADFGESV